MAIYTHAKDFLIELAENKNTYGWLKDLVIRTVKANGKLTDDDLEATEEQLKINGASTLVVPAAPSANASSIVRFIKLSHKGGVCALAPNQYIDFSEDITLIYGGNGSGKSSYFRILNELVGGNREIPLHHNIYTPANPIDVELEFTENGEQKTLKWDGHGRSFEPLNLSSVFDTEYSSTFLQKRSADGAIVMPYGLHLFTALTGAMDNIKGRLENEITAISRTLPAINTDGLSDDIKRIITQQHYTTRQKTDIERCYTISDAELQTLESSEKQLKQLIETNFEDKIKIKSGEKQLIEDLRNHIADVTEKLEKSCKASSELFIKIKNARKASDEAKAKMAVLSEIGNTDSAEWRNFVSAGVAFSKSSEIAADICPYCRQELTSNAASIVSAYSDYLSDQTQTTLATLLKTKTTYKTEIEKLHPTYRINEALSKCIEQQTDMPALKDDVQNTLNVIQQYKDTLLGQYVDENSEIKAVPSSIAAMLDTLQQILDRYMSIITGLNEDKSKRDQQINDLKERMKSLIEHKSISTQKEVFTDWFTKVHQIHELTSFKSQLSTKSISTLAKTAGQYLVTNNLKVKFQEELNAMGLSKLQVNLEEASASRGKSYMQIRLTNDAAAREILSEGEQKGVALALFIAERRMQLTNNPIILDDPVNSLDHRITGKFIERLTKLNNQIVIFSHNILLRTTLLSLHDVHECGKNQRASCNKQSKHLFLYLVQSQGRDMTGVLTDGKQEKAKNYLHEAKCKLDKVPFTDISGTTSSLRHAIELMVDEVILNNQVPVKFHGKKNSIYWEQLKDLKPDAALIDKLNGYYSRLSGGDLHAGIEQTENPIEYDELRNMYDNLISVLH